VGKRGKGRGVRAKRPSSSPPPIQNRGGVQRRVGCGRPVAIAGEPGPGGGWAVGKNEEGFIGNRFPYLPWAVVARGGGFLGRRQTGGGGLGGDGSLVCREEGARLVAVRGEVRNAAGFFIGAERRFGGRYFELMELSRGRQWWLGKNPAWTPAGGIRGQPNAVGLDSSCRCIGRGRRGGERRRGAVVEVTSRGELWWWR
jgi:hypothetical protein